MDAPEKKTCDRCAMEIPGGAQVCPHCGRAQTKSRRFMRHPLVITVFAVTTFFTYAFVMESIFPGRRHYPTYAGQIEVVESRLVFGEGRCGPTVGVVGALRNASRTWWQGARLHVEFRDAEGKIVDAAHTEQFVGSYDVPGAATLAFEVSFERKYPQAQYATAAVRIVSAKDARDWP